MSKITDSRRGFLKTTGLGVGALATPGILRRASAQQGGVVNVWTYANFIPDDFKAEFESETGIEVRIRLVDDQGKQFNLMAAEADSPTADIVTVAGHRFKQFINSELLAPLDPARLKNWNTVNAIYREADWLEIDGAIWGVPILAGSEVLAYNTELVTPEEADSWAIMFDPKYEGQTAYTIQDFMSITMQYLGHDGTMVSYLNDPDKARQVVEEARDHLIANKNMVRKYYDSGAEVQQMFINGDIAVALAWSGPISKLIMDGFPVEMTIPKEGSFAFVYSLNLANEGPNQDNAYRFLDALLARPEIGAEMTRAAGFISTFEGAEEHLSDLERRAASFSQEELDRLVFFNTDADEIKYPLVDPAVEQVKAS